MLNGFSLSGKDGDGFSLSHPQICSMMVVVLKAACNYFDRRRPGSASIFVGGFVLGGLIFGTLNCVYAPQANEMLHHKANLNGYLACHTGQNLDRINQDTDRDFFMSAREAKEYVLIGGIIMNPLKALQPLAVMAEAETKVESGV
ncbi:uncharacterized protein LOC126729123 [Quercus robur]|uniref:uncharacterized protein LOC126729123 n=1 Tax=Quercus robur TaxID=38942 RepID=UPI002161B7E1|nr:uncharacterized protein LOC126729123 [Quercus robur]